MRSAHSLFKETRQMLRGYEADDKTTEWLEEAAQDADEATEQADDGEDFVAVASPSLPALDETQIDYVDEQENEQLDDIEVDTPVIEEIQSPVTYDDSSTAQVEDVSTAETPEFTTEAIDEPLVTEESGEDVEAPAIETSSDPEQIAAIDPGVETEDVGTAELELNRSQDFDSQIQDHKQITDDMMERLSAEFDPKFDMIRDIQVQAMHDYVDNQTLMTTLLRDKG